MAEFPSMPLFTDAYLADTRHLTCLEHGAYLQLLMVAWRTPDGSLPNDERFIARCCGLTVGQWRRIRSTIMGFFVLENGRLVQQRLRDELNHVRQVRESQAANGRASALKRKGRHLTDRVSSVSEASTPTPTPTPLRKETPNGVPKRRASRLPEDWTLPMAWGAWANGEFGWPREEVLEEAERFKDYWVGKSGKDATKLDWEATWRNWCRGSRRPARAAKKFVMPL